MAGVNSLYELGISRRVALPHRIAIMSVHTSPLDQPGTGDAGGMNVYIVETSRRLAQAGVEVEVFTRCTSPDMPAQVEMVPGVTVRHIVAGPFSGVTKEDLPGQLRAFTEGVLQVEDASPPGRYGLIHSHYWMSGAVGRVARTRWGVPLVHTAHTLAKVKNQMRARGEAVESLRRIQGEEAVVASSDILVANTATEAHELIELYGASSDQVKIVSPGVNLDTFFPSPEGGVEARKRLGIAPDAVVIAFVGRIQPLKAPDVVVRAAAEIRAHDPDLARRLVVVICGGPSGSRTDQLVSLMGLADHLDLGSSVRFLPPRSREDLVDVYRSADCVAVPSHNESFGLVALEAQACGTPVVAAAVGGLVTAVRDGVSGLLVTGHNPGVWAKTLGDLLHRPSYRDDLSRGAAVHAQQFSWGMTASGLLAAYRQAVTRHRCQWMTTTACSCCS